MALLAQETWTIPEKKRLISLLRQYPISAYQAISKKMRTRRPDEVQDYIEKITMAWKRHVANTKIGKVEASKKAPLEHWLEMCTDLVENESFDCSNHLSKVMSMIAHFEKFPEKLGNHDVTPDYKSIYRYLSQILQGDRKEDIEPLKPLESAIMLDILHSLMDVLTKADTTVQRNVLRWKCQLMSMRDGHNKPFEENLRKVAENDFSDFIDGELEHEKTLVQSFQLVRDVHTEKVDAIALNKPVVKRSSYTVVEEAVEIQSPSVKKRGLSSWQNSTVKPGRKSKDFIPGPPTTEIIMVRPPENCKILKIAPRQKKVVHGRCDGKYTPLSNDSLDVDLAAELSTPAKPNESTASPNPGQSTPSSRPGQSTASPKPCQSTPSSRPEQPTRTTKSAQCASLPQPAMSEEKLEEIKAKHKKHKRKYDILLSDKVDNQSTPWKPKKPKLYALNPLCVPVSLLDLDD